MSEVIEKLDERGNIIYWRDPEGASVGTNMMIMIMRFIIKIL